MQNNGPAPVDIPTNFSENQTERFLWDFLSR